MIEFFGKLLAMEAILYIAWLCFTLLISLIDYLDYKFDLGYVKGDYFDWNDFKSLHRIPLVIIGMTLIILTFLILCKI